jgi:hypothetical protein
VLNVAVPEIGLQRVGIVPCVRQRVPARMSQHTRAMREGLDEETLALFDLLKKPDLEKKDIGRIKKVAVELFAILKRKKQEIDDWRAKEQTRDEMRQAIHDFLYSDATACRRAMRNRRWTPGQKRSSRTCIG